MLAPVASHRLRMFGDRLVGHAAPSGGPAYCQLELRADDITISVARATRFSADAKTAGIRLGWCGVSVPGLAAAAAIGSALTVRCVVSGRVLWRKRVHAPIAPQPVRRSRLTVFELIELSRAEDCAPRLAEIRPLMRRHFLDRGAGDFVDASFKTFLGRGAEAETVLALAGNGGEDRIDVILDSIMGSAEYAANRLRSIPGPFNAAFRYELTALG